MSGSGAGDFFDTGFDAAKVEADRRQSGLSADGRLPRWWVSAGENTQRTLIWLDDFTWKYMGHDAVPFLLNEHVMCIDGDTDRQIIETCTKKRGVCQFCELNYSRQYVGIFTVLDVTPYKARDGIQMIKPVKKLLPATQEAMATIKAKVQQLSNRNVPMQGSQFLVGRYDAKRHPKVGSDFSFEEHHKDIRAYLQAIYKQFNIPADPDKVDLAPYGMNSDQAVEWYRKQLAPRTPEELAALTGNGHRLVDIRTAWEAKNAGGGSRGGRGGGGGRVQGGDDGQAINY